jgi:DNA-binding transcriptional regulator GbsR (MarR family)
MELKEARRHMIDTWGQLSAHWGIPRSMGQIHALLIISPDPLSADQIIAELGLSRGIVSMHLRSLMEWGVVHKSIVPGERREYFQSEKDVWHMALQIARERKRRELDPLIATLRDLNVPQTDEAHRREAEEMKKMADQVMDVAMHVDKVLEVGIRSGSQGLLRKLINILR